MAVKNTHPANMRWHYQYAGRCCAVCVATDIVQIMINFLRNAADAAPTGQGKIWIRTQNVEEPGNPQGVMITVRDDGEGIPEHMLEEIFFEGVTTRRGPGRGYGLAVVRELAARNSGTVKIRRLKDSRDGARTEAQLVLPRTPCREGGRA